MLHKVLQRKAWASCLEQEGAGKLPSGTLGRGTGDRGCRGLGYRWSSQQLPPGLHIPPQPSTGPPRRAALILEVGWALLREAVRSQDPSHAQDSGFETLTATYSLKYIL